MIPEKRIDNRIIPRSKILIVDGDEVLSQEYRSALEKDGHDVQSVSVTADALSEVSKTDFDLVLLSYAL